jgi:hypothetical protein
MATRWITTTTRLLTTRGRPATLGKPSRPARAPLTAPRRNQRKTPAWSRRAARCAGSRVGCGGDKNADRDSGHGKGDRVTWLLDPCEAGR